MHHLTFSISSWLQVATQMSKYPSKILQMSLETHPSPGMRSHWPVIPAIRLLWTIMTPLGLPVEPLVYITTARSDGWGSTITLATVKQRKASLSCTVPGTQQKAQPEHVREIHTVLGLPAPLSYGLHAVDGESCRVAFCAHFLLIHIDHMLQVGDLWQHALNRKSR